MPEKRWYSLPRLYRRAENAALLVYNLIRAVERSANLSAFIVGLESHLLSAKDRHYPSTARNARSRKRAGKIEGKLLRATTTVQPRDDVEPRRATRFTSALRLCISGCVCSTKRPSSPSSSHLNATSDPTNACSARNAPAHPSGRSSALLLRPFGPRIGCFSHLIFYFSTSSRLIPSGWYVRGFRWFEEATCSDEKKKTHHFKKLSLSFELSP